VLPGSFVFFGRETEQIKAERCQTVAREVAGRGSRVNPCTQRAARDTMKRVREEKSFCQRRAEWEAKEIAK